MDLGLGAGPLAAVEGLHGELDEDLVGRCAALFGGLLDALPLLGSDASVLLDSLSHVRSFEYLVGAGAKTDDGSRVEVPLSG